MTTLPLRLLLTSALFVGCTGDKDFADSSGDAHTEGVDTSSSKETVDSPDDTSGHSDTDVHSDTDGEDTGTPPPPERSVTEVATSKLLGETSHNAHVSCPPIAAGGHDLTGDGTADLAIGVGCAAGGGPYAGGSVYVIQGVPPGTTSLGAYPDRLDGADDERLGSSIASGSDIDGDGWMDLLAGAPFGSLGELSSGDWPGQAYLFSGPLSGRRASTEADAVLIGEVIDVTWNVDSAGVGNAVSTLGDTNGDGYGELLLGGREYDGSSGVAYILRGPVAGTVELAEAETRIYGEGAAHYAGVGYELDGTMDLTGDGVRDAIISGGTDLILGMVLDGTTIGVLTDTEADARFLWSSDRTTGQLRVLAVGDLNGDGRTDLAIFGQEEVGEPELTTVLFTDPLAPEIVLADLPDRLVGDVEWNGAGVANIGDMNGDGAIDLVGQAQLDAPGRWQGAYLLYGPFAGSRPLREADLLIRGDDGDYVGAELAVIPDLTGDGAPEVLLSAPGDDEAGKNAGAVWLLSGTGW